ncbi:MAG: hypothetical protein KAH15_03705 [Candidatus Marinimicrobia bacterium]|nr:hypothetical protein [Candidatus Neomarinimicrobiota bacterium]
MKINLLREDQMTKVPHQDKEKEVLRFDDTFSGGNDDFYFQQPAPPTEEYKKPRKFHFWIFLLIFIICGAATIFIIEPGKTLDFFGGFGRNVAKVWNRTIDKIQTSWIHRNDREVVYFETPVLQEPKTAPVKEEVKEIIKKAPQQIIKVKKSVEKEIIKESTEEKILKSPVIYGIIRDELALSHRNLMAAEFVWSKIPGGMTLDKLTISEDKLSISVKSRFPMLIQSYSNFIEQHNMFTSVFSGNEEKIGEETRVQLTSDLPALREEDRPERIWDLDVEWFDDYLAIAANSTDVIVSQTIYGSKTMDVGIVRHDINVTVYGNRTAMMLFLQELQTIPAAFAVRDITSTYHVDDQSNQLDLTLVFYERE